MEDSNLKLGKFSTIDEAKQILDSLNVFDDFTQIHKAFVSSCLAFEKKEDRKKVLEEIKNFFESFDTDIINDDFQDESSFTDNDRQMQQAVQNFKELQSGIDADAFGYFLEKKFMNPIPNWLLTELPELDLMKQSQVIEIIKKYQEYFINNMPELNILDKSVVRKFLLDNIKADEFDKEDNISLKSLTKQLEDNIKPYFEKMTFEDFKKLVSDKSNAKKLPDEIFEWVKFENDNQVSEIIENHFKNFNQSCFKSLDRRILTPKATKLLLTIFDSGIDYFSMTYKTVLLSLLNLKENDLNDLEKEDLKDSNEKEIKKGVVPDFINEIYDKHFKEFIEDNEEDNEKSYLSSLDGENLDDEEKKDKEALDAMQKLHYLSAGNKDKFKEAYKWFLKQEYIDKKNIPIWIVDRENSLNANLNKNGKTKEEIKEKEILIKNNNTIGENSEKSSVIEFEKKSENQKRALKEQNKMEEGKEENTEISKKQISLVANYLKNLLLNPVFKNEILNNAQGLANPNENRVENKPIKKTEETKNKGKEQIETNKEKSKTIEVNQKTKPVPGKPSEETRVDKIRDSLEKLGGELISKGLAKPNESRVEVENEPIKKVEKTKQEEQIETNEKKSKIIEVSQQSKSFPEKPSKETEVDKIRDSLEKLGDKLISGALLNEFLKLNIKAQIFLITKYPQCFSDVSIIQNMELKVFAVSFSTLKEEFKKTKDKGQLIEFLPESFWDKTNKELAIEFLVNNYEFFEGHMQKFFETFGNDLAYAFLESDNKTQISCIKKYPEYFADKSIMENIKLEILVTPGVFEALVIGLEKNEKEIEPVKSLVVSHKDESYNDDKQVEIKLLFWPNRFRIEKIDDDNFKTLENVDRVIFWSKSFWSRNDQKLFIKFLYKHDEIFKNQMRPLFERFGNELAYLFLEFEDEIQISCITRYPKYFTSILGDIKLDVLVNPTVFEALTKQLGRTIELDDLIPSKFWGNPDKRMLIKVLYENRDVFKDKDYLGSFFDKIGERLKDVFSGLDYKSSFKGDRYEFQKGCIINYPEFFANKSIRKNLDLEVLTDRNVFRTFAEGVEDPTKLLPEDFWNIKYNFFTVGNEREYEKEDYFKDNEKSVIVVIDGTNKQYFENKYSFIKYILDSKKIVDSDKSIHTEMLTKPDFDKNEKKLVVELKNSKSEPEKVRAKAKYLFHPKIDNIKQESIIKFISKNHDIFERSEQLKSLFDKYSEGLGVEAFKFFLGTGYIDLIPDWLLDKFLKLEHKEQISLINAYPQCFGSEDIMKRLNKEVINDKAVNEKLNSQIKGLIATQIDAKLIGIGKTEKYRKRRQLIERLRELPAYMDVYKEVKNDFDSDQNKTKTSENADPIYDETIKRISIKIIVKYYNLSMLLGNYMGNLLKKFGEDLVNEFLGSGNSKALSRIKEKYPKYFEPNVTKSSNEINSAATGLHLPQYKIKINQQTKSIMYTDKLEIDKKSEIESIVKNIENNAIKNVMEYKDDDKNEGNEIESSISKLISENHDILIEKAFDRIMISVYNKEIVPETYFQKTYFQNLCVIDNKSNNNKYDITSDNEACARAASFYGDEDESNDVQEQEPEQEPEVNETNIDKFMNKFHNRVDYREINRSWDFVIKSKGKYFLVQADDMRNWTGKPEVFEWFLKEYDGLIPNWLLDRFLKLKIKDQITVIIGCPKCFADKSITKKLDPEIFDNEKVLEALAKKVEAPIELLPDYFWCSDYRKVTVGFMEKHKNIFGDGTKQLSEIFGKDVSSLYPETMDFDLKQALEDSKFYKTVMSWDSKSLGTKLNKLTHSDVNKIVKLGLDKELKKKYANWMKCLSKDNLNYLFSKHLTKFIDDDSKDDLIYLVSSLAAKKCCIKISKNDLKKLSQKEWLADLISAEVSSENEKKESLDIILNHLSDDTFVCFMENYSILDLALKNKIKNKIMEYNNFSKLSVEKQVCCIENFMSDEKFAYSIISNIGSIKIDVITHQEAFDVLKKYALYGDKKNDLVEYLFRELSDKLSDFAFENNKSLNFRPFTYGEFSTPKLESFQDEICKDYLFASMNIETINFVKLCKFVAQDRDLFSEDQRKKLLAEYQYKAPLVDVKLDNLPFSILVDAGFRLKNFEDFSLLSTLKKKYYLSSHPEEVTENNMEWLDMSILIDKKVAYYLKSYYTDPRKANKLIAVLLRCSSLETPYSSDNANTVNKFALQYSEFLTPAAVDKLIEFDKQTNHSLSEETIDSLKGVNGISGEALGYLNQNSTRSHLANSNSTENAQDKDDYNDYFNRGENSDNLSNDTREFIGKLDQNGLDRVG